MSAEALPNEASEPPPEEEQSFRGTVALETHGCKLNQADSETLARRFQEAGYRLVSLAQHADVYVVNTCTVTHVADSKARQALRSAHRRNPDATVVATGCYAQRDPAAITTLQGVDLVLGNTEKPGLVERVRETRGGAPQSLTDTEAPQHLPYSPGRSRAMVKIQEGCNQVCAYCIVPKVRGREQSIPPAELASQLQALESEGYREVVLTGTQLGSYGFDLDGQSLTRLIATLLAETTIPRLRVSSLQPQEISQELLELWQDPRLCPHFHVPLQSGADSVLRRMQRRYTTAMYREAVDRIRSDLTVSSVTSDVIVGFPGETEDDFDQGLAFVEEMALASMHVFPYSRRPGTGAAHMGDQVDEVAKRVRMGAMLAVAEESRAAYAQDCVGQIRPVLWERATAKEGTGWRFSGLTDSYLRVTTVSDRDLSNEITQARLEEAGPQAVYASLEDDTIGVA